MKGKKKGVKELKKTYEGKKRQKVKINNEIKKRKDIYRSLKVVTPKACC